MYEIIFDGVKKKDNLNYLIFKYGRKIIEIPVPTSIASHIMIYINKNVPPPQDKVEVGKIKS